MLDNRVPILSPQLNNIGQGPWLVTPGAAGMGLDLDFNHGKWTVSSLGPSLSFVF